ncbi:MAG: hypothetical protein M1826_000259 [Phylliscum demangeonii]|nr:MAG: hypothetical protein M1826_000259 [Phylliscum demangeonii]
MSEGTTVASAPKASDKSAAATISSKVDASDVKGKGKGRAIEDAEDDDEMDDEEDDDDDDEDDEADLEDDEEDEDEEMGGDDETAKTGTDHGPVLEKVSTTNIINSGRRTRGKNIDFAKAGDDLVDEDEDEDDDFKADGVEDAHGDAMRD